MLEAIPEVVRSCPFVYGSFLFVALVVSGWYTYFPPEGKR